MKNKGSCKLLSMTGLVFTMLMLTLVVPSHAPAAAPHEQTSIHIRCGKFGGNAYLFGFALADLINKHSDWLRATAIEGGGTVGNLKVAVKLPPEKRRLTMQTGTEFIYRQAATGEEPIGAKYQYTGFRAVARYFAATHVWIAVNPKIKTAEDMIGKKVSVSPLTSAKGVLGDLQLKGMGLNDKVKLSHLADVPQANALRDGLIDVGYVSVTALPGKWKPVPAYTQLMTLRGKWHFIDTPEGTMAKASKIAGREVAPLIIPAGMFGKNQPEPVRGLAVVNALWTDASAPENVVYEVCRIIYEYADKFPEYGATLKSVERNKLGEVPGPATTDNWHPGAFKLYKEKRVKLGIQ